jgi:hypothetical protein
MLLRAPVNLWRLPEAGAAARFRQASEEGPADIAVGKPHLAVGKAAPAAGGLLRASPAIL